jgi:SPP1 family predicted phage head-tail adaptor
MMQGRRQYRVTFQTHNKVQDAHGNYDFKAGSSWSDEIVAYPCSFQTVRGGEVLRGRQVQPETTHVLHGEYHGGKNVTTDMRCIIDDIVYNVVSVFDPEGRRRQMRIELKRNI